MDFCERPPIAPQRYRHQGSVGLSSCMSTRRGKKHLHPGVWGHGMKAGWVQATCLPQLCHCRAREPAFVSSALLIQQLPNAGA